MEKEKIYQVRNRSASMVVYKIPEDNIRREFAPGEVKKIKFDELEKLSFQRGGRNLMANFLQITDEEALNNLNIKTEPEYNMDEKQIDELILHGSLDAFLDCLDFAPVGVIDLIKVRAVALPMNDMPKRNALLEKTGFDTTKAVQHVEEEKMADKAVAGAAAAPERRVKIDEPTEGRRTTPNYKIIKKEEPAATTEE